MTIQVPELDLSQWLDALRPYQRDTVETLLEGTSAEEAAQKWLISTGSPNISQFGGGSNPKPFWDQFKREFYRFICDDDAYVEEKKALGGQVAAPTVVLVSVISSAVATALGFVASLFVPAVALMLSVVAKMGVNAFCACTT